MKKHFSSLVEHRLHEIFEFSLLAKGLFAATELLSGIAIYFVSAAWVLAAVNWLVSQEIIEDPTDHLANWLLGLVPGYSVSTQDFWAFYLISHGVVKLLIVAALAMRLLWAYPASIVVLGAFIIYQLDRFVTTGSPFLIALSLFDLVVIWLVWHEYQGMRALPRPR